MSHAPRPAGLKLIIAYKLGKAPIMLALAVWLTFAPVGAYEFALRIANDLHEGGVLSLRLSAFIRAHLTAHFVLEGAIVAWFETATTTLEGLLLWSGRLWGSWIVAGGLAALIPLEIHSFVVRPTALRLIVPIANGAIVFYLVYRLYRLRPRHAALAAQQTEGRA